MVVQRKILLTGGMGFIGSHFVDYWRAKYPEDLLINMDAMTYAARPSLNPEHNGLNYVFIRGDISNPEDVSKVFTRYEPDHVINMAAESHVCNSIKDPEPFVKTNYLGTFNLLEQFRKRFRTGGYHRFLQVSTDEVFGELGPSGKFSETTPYAPRSPYAASKATADMLVKAYHETYRLDAVITNCTNNYGPNQHPEKLIPKTVKHLLAGEPATLYGDGSQIRDWLHVREHCSALDKVFHAGAAGESYCVGGECEVSVKTLVLMLSEILKNLKPDISPAFIFTEDRPTDDWRYAVDTSKIQRLGWAPTPEAFYKNMEETVRWYLEKGFE